ncbi:hypothetical protein TSAR_001670 [Trichomalopsis sarcophagae]|uniref:Uncharacterized protein n=1 Tax=Trichomalopsis sarcophagae TaxID=543379 RepID=A0A232EFX0_9HYME|nr:hypothetical protein TSAR_001670 [Trichomalopsis sarcophagae]
MKNRTPARKATISNGDLPIRLAYANQHRLRTEAEWRRTVAIDEKGDAQFGGLMAHATSLSMLYPREKAAGTLDRIGLGYLVMAREI